jgi:hypothetical protein
MYLCDGRVLFHTSCVQGGEQSTDLRALAGKLASGSYAGPAYLAADLAAMFQVAAAYPAGTQQREAALQCEALFQALWQQLMSQY